MIIMILILCTGCRNEEKSLTICVDSSFMNQAKDLIDSLQQFNKDIEVKLVVLPKKADEAEIKITEIRTAIMSGEGPDIFLLSTYLRNGAEDPITLFDNVEKTMQSEIFLPLDDYMNQAQFMHADAYNPLIFNSGKTEEGQLVLPITYGYNVGAYLKNDDNYSTELPYSWDELVNDKKYDLEKKYIPQLFASFIDVFGEYADYKSNVLLYTEAEMLTRVQEAISLRTETYSLADFENGNKICPIGIILATAKSNENYILNAVPSVEGGITANVSMYAAINRNTRWPQEAFSILDILFSDEVMTGRGFMVGEKCYGNSVVVPGLYNGILTHEEGCRSSSDISDESLQAFNDLNSRITNVRYYSNLDDDIFEMYQKCLYAENEEEQRMIVSQIYKRMQMKLAE